MGIQSGKISNIFGQSLALKFGVIHKKVDPVQTEYRMEHGVKGIVLVA
jgi:hypothetical protein